MLSLPELTKFPEARYLGRRIYRFTRIHSTNLELLDGENKEYRSGDIAAADEQTSGLGRYQRHWISDFGGIYFSVLFEEVEDLSNFYPFVILCSLAVHRKASDVLGTSEDLKIKWPNDVYHGDRKLCGILVQSKSSGRLSRTVVGIGMNINNQTPPDRELRNPAVSLSQLTGHPLDRAELFRELVLSIDRIYSDFIHGRFSSFIPELDEHLYHRNRHLSFNSGRENYTVKPLGFNEKGNLLAEVDGRSKLLTYGEFL